MRTRLNPSDTYKCLKAYCGWKIGAGDKVAIVGALASYPVDRVINFLATITVRGISPRLRGQSIAKRLKTKSCTVRICFGPASETFLAVLQMSTRSTRALADSMNMMRPIRMPDFGKIFDVCGTRRNMR